MELWTWEVVFLGQITSPTAGLSCKLKVFETFYKSKEKKRFLWDRCCVKVHPKKFELDFLVISHPVSVGLRGVSNYHWPAKQETGSILDVSLQRDTQFKPKCSLTIHLITCRKWYVSCRLSIKDTGSNRPVSASGQVSCWQITNWVMPVDDWAPVRSTFMTFKPQFKYLSWRKDRCCEPKL